MANFFNHSDVGKRNRSPSPIGSGHSAKRTKLSNSTLAGSVPPFKDSQESLFDMLVKKKRAKSRNYFSVPFVGMKSVGEKARLV